MTQEELLRPRYKVIAQYPFSSHPNGEIIKATTGGTYFDQYPHIFKKLEWWEDRKPEDMPEYIKEGRFIHKSTWRLNSLGEVILTVSDTDWHVNANVMHWFQPATEQEYLEYIKQK